MLCLSLKPGQTLHIGNDITVTLRECSGGRASLGIVAPRVMDIKRGEIYGKPPPVALPVPTPVVEKLP